jgi:excisionase family DNA binding protein
MVGTKGDPMKMLSPKSVAALLDCKPAHVYRLIRAGHLDSVCFGRKMTRVPEESVSRYIDSCRVSGQSSDTKVIGTPSEDAAILNSAARLARVIEQERKRSSAG